MTAHLTLSQLESYLWGTAVILRGLVDAGDYTQFIFPLVFYKRLSDVWDEDCVAALESYSGAAELAKAEADERFVIPEGAHWNDVRQPPKDIGRALQTAMRAIEAANPGRFDGSFGDAPWTNKERLPDATLKNLLEHVSSQTLSIARVPEHQQRIADAYRAFANHPGFCRVTDQDQIAANGRSLSIPLDVKRQQHDSETAEAEDQRSLCEVWDDWEQDGRAFWQQMDALP